MIKVKIIFMGYLSDFTGIKEILIDLPDNSTFKDLLKYIRKTYGQKFPQPLYEDNQFKMIHLMLNLRDIYEDKDSSRILTDGDILHLIPPIVGG